MRYVVQGRASKVTLLRTDSWKEAVDCYKMSLALFEPVEILQVLDPEKGEPADPYRAANVTDSGYAVVAGTAIPIRR